MKRFMIVLMVLFVFLVDGPSFAQRGGGWGRGPGGGRRDQGGLPDGEQCRGMSGGGKISAYILEVRSGLTEEQYFQLRSCWPGLAGGKDSCVVRDMALAMDLTVPGIVAVGLQ